VQASKQAGKQAASQAVFEMMILPLSNVFKLCG